MHFCNMIHMNTRHRTSAIEREATCHEILSLLEERQWETRVYTNKQSGERILENVIIYLHEILQPFETSIFIFKEVVFKKNNPFANWWRLWDENHECKHCGKRWTYCRCKTWEPCRVHNSRFNAGDNQWIHDICSAEKERVSADISHCRWKSRERHKKNLWEAAETVLDQCGGLPLALGVCGTSISVRRKVAVHLSLQEVLREFMWERQFRTIPRFVLKENVTQYDHSNLSSALATSLSHLDETPSKRVSSLLRRGVPRSCHFG